jgi:hypothetical protein
MKLTDKTVAKTPARGPRTKGALPRYVAIGNSKKKPVKRNVLIPARVYADYDINGELIGVEIKG